MTAGANRLCRQFDVVVLFVAGVAATLLNDAFWYSAWLATRAKSFQLTGRGPCGDICQVGCKFLTSGVMWYFLLLHFHYADLVMLFSAGCQCVGAYRYVSAR